MRFLCVGTIYETDSSNKTGIRFIIEKVFYYFGNHSIVYKEFLCEENRDYSILKISEEFQHVNPEFQISKKKISICDTTIDWSSSFSEDFKKLTSGMGYDIELEKFYIGKKYSNTI